MSRSRSAPTSTPSFWTLQIAGWLAFGIAMGLSRVARYPLGYMLATKSVLMVLGFALTLGLRALYRPLLAREFPLGRIIVAATLVSYAAALVWTALYNL